MTILKLNKHSKNRKKCQNRDTCATQLCVPHWINLY